MSAPDVRPAIPVSLAGCPAIGGVVVPWINIRLADGGADFRATHRRRWEESFRGRLCQICGNPLTRPLVLFGGPAQIAAGSYFDEPPMHPECARYAARACPMVAGRMSAYSDRPSLADGRRGARCPEPDCGCAGWVPDGGRTPSGGPAHPWYAVWAVGYALAVTPEGKLLGASVAANLRVRTRPVEPS